MESVEVNDEAGVAETIRKQIGVWALMAVGARNFMKDATTLYFDAKPKSRIVRVAVRLEPSDTYSVTALNKRTGAVIYRQDDVHAAELQIAVDGLQYL